MKKKPVVAGFSERLYRARTPPHQKEEISHAQIARELKVTRNAVTKWESKAEPAIKPSNLFKLCDFLRVRARWLATDKGPMEIELADPVKLLAEDCATLPSRYFDAVRQYTDDLLDALRALPSLRRPIEDGPVERAGYVPMPSTPAVEPRAHEPGSKPYVESSIHGSPGRLKSAPKKSGAHKRGKP